LEPKIYRFTLDIHKTGVQYTLFATKGDSNSVRAIISLSESTKPFKLPENTSIVTLYADKPDGTQIYNTCLIEDNLIILDFSGQTFAAAGDVLCELKIITEDENDKLTTLTTPKFIVSVSEPLQNDLEIMSTDEYNALAEALLSAQQKETIAKQYAEAAEASKNAAAASASAAETAKNAAAASASQADSAKTSALQSASTAQTAASTASEAAETAETAAESAIEAAKDVLFKANLEIIPDTDMGLNGTPPMAPNPDETGIYELVSYSPAGSSDMKKYYCTFNPALSNFMGCDTEPVVGAKYYVVCGDSEAGYPTYNFSRIKDVADKQDKLSEEQLQNINDVTNKADQEDILLKANMEMAPVDSPTYSGGNEFPNGYYTITLKPDSPGPGYTEVAFTPSVAAIIYYGPNTAVPAGLDTGSTVYVESSSSGFSAFSVVKDVKDKADIEYVNNNFSDVILERSDSTAGETVVVDCCLKNQYPVSSIIVGAKITYTENSISIPKNPVMHFGPYNPTDDETDNIQTITVETELCRIESTADTYDLISKKLTKQIKSADIELSETTTSITLGNGGNVPNAIALPDLPAYFVSLSDSDTITFVEKVTPSPGTTTYTLTQPIQTGYVIYVTSNPEVSTLNTDSLQLITSDKCEFYADGTTSSGGSAVFDSYMETKKSANLYLKKIMQLIGGGTDLPVYSGSYTVTPKTTAQSMETSDKIMTDNVTIKEIPYSEVSNPQSGKTVIIGGTEIDN
jgi:hypothetical protein